MEKTKYKFIETTGCTAFDFSINDKSLSDISPAEQNEILDYLIVKLKEGIKEQSIQLPQIVSLFQYDEFGQDEHSCGQCGDTVSWTEWNI